MYYNLYEYLKCNGEFKPTLHIKLIKVLDKILELLLFSYQNFTQDNETQGIIEKSQWEKNPL